MVYVDSRNLGYKPYISRWLNSRSKPGEAEALQLLMDKYAVPAIDWVAEGLDGHDLVKKPLQSVPHTNLNMAEQLCRLLDATLIDHPKMQDPQVSAGHIATGLECLEWIRQFSWMLDAAAAKPYV
jgi:dynein heavy chain